MQAVVGTAIFIVICLAAAGFASTKTEQEEGFVKFVVFVSYSVAGVVGCYVALTIIGGVLWVIGWLAILLREIMQWIVEAVLYPLDWIS